MNVPFLLFDYYYYTYYFMQVHAILKALPQNTQGEKRELDKETVKEQEDENVQKSSNETASKEQSKKMSKESN